MISKIYVTLCIIGQGVFKNKYESSYDNYYNYDCAQVQSEDALSADISGRGSESKKLGLFSKYFSNTLMLR